MSRIKNTQKIPARKANSKMWVLAVLAMVIMAIGAFTTTSFGGSNDKSTTPAVTGEGVKIIKSDITSTVKFYPIEIDKVKMEVIAVKASDGTIRTALNTCQICYQSGRGYYKQEGNEVICQNCKNRFKLDQIEKVRGGCNPVPILKAEKTEDEKTIFISKEVLAKYKQLFANWKK